MISFPITRELLAAFFFKTFLLLIVLGLFPVSGMSQNAKIDSLKIILQSIPSGIEEIDILNELAYELHKQDLKQAETYAERAYLLARDNAYQKGESSALRTKGIIMLFQGQIDSARTHAQASRDLAIALDDPEMIVKSCNVLAAVYNSVADNDQAIKYYQESLKASDRLRDTSILIILLLNVAFIHIESENEKEANVYFKRVSQLNIDNQPEGTQMYIHLGSGMDHEYHNRSEQAKYHLEAARKLALKLGDQYTYGVSLDYLGQVALQENKLDTAEYYLLKAMDLYEEVGYSDKKEWIYAQLAELYSIQGDYDKSIAFANTGYAIALETKSKDHLVKFAQLLSYAYEQKSNYEESLHYHKIYKTWSDSLFNTNKLQTILDIETKYQVDLLEEKQVRLLEEQRAQNLSFISFILLIGGLSFFLWYRVQVNRKLNRELEHKVEERTKDLQKSNEELTKKNYELEQFNYITSHDLQEPLRTITNFSELLIDKYHDLFDEVGKKSLLFIKDSTVRMSDLIHGLLTYSRIGNTRKIEDVDMNAILIRVRKDLRFAIAEAEAQFHIPLLPVIQGVKTDLQLLVQNLVSNALKFRNPEVPVQIELIVKDKANHWQFSIRDNGIGVEKEHQDKIFEIFQRLHTRDKYEGTGIGLAHCKKIVEFHQGTIWVCSTKGEGSVFSFTIKKELGGGMRFES